MTVPPAPDRPTRDSSRKQFTKSKPSSSYGTYRKMMKRKRGTSHTRGTPREQRQPSLTPHNKSWPPRPHEPPGWSESRKDWPEPSGAPSLWQFVKYKWQTLDDSDKIGYSWFGVLIWIILWMFSGFLSSNLTVFIIPFMLLTIIGVTTFIIVVKNFAEKAWNKYFPEYREFTQNHKPKNGIDDDPEQMATLSELFEEHEEVSAPPKLDPRITPKAYRGNYPSKEDIDDLYRSTKTRK